LIPTTTSQNALAQDFGLVADLIHLHAQELPESIALRDSESTLTYATLDALMDRVAAALQRDGLVAVVPLASGSDPTSLARMSLIESYGMTEGGVSFLFEAHLHPTKLHTVGRTAAGCDVRLIDEAGHEVPPGEAGEVVGHSAGMMVGYHRQPEKTREAEWFAPDGKRFIRTGDVGRFDKAMLRAHPGVADVAVVGVPSKQWGETPVAFVVRRDGDGTTPEALLQWANAQLGKTQRLADLRFIDELPRSAIGKVLKRELRELHGGG